MGEVTKVIAVNVTVNLPRIFLTAGKRYDQLCNTFLKITQIKKATGNYPPILMGPERKEKSGSAAQHPSKIPSEKVSRAPYSSACLL